MIYSLKFTISSTLFHLLHNFAEKIMFFRDVVFGRLPASILEAFGSIWTGLGLQVGAMLAQVGSQLGLQLRFLASFGRSWRLELALNFNKSSF